MSSAPFSMAGSLLSAGSLSGHSRFLYVYTVHGAWCARIVEILCWDVILTYLGPEHLMSIAVSLQDPE